MKKNILLILGLFVVLPCFAEAQNDYQRGQQLILDAFQVTRDSSYIADMRFQDLLLSVTRQATVYRRKTEKTVYKRVDLYTKDQVTESYIANESGQYGIRSGVAGKIGEVLVLSLSETIHTPLDSYELKLSQYTIRETNYRGITCLEVTMTTSLKPKLLAIMSCVYSDGEVNDPQSNFYKKRPVVRVFLIDRQDHFLYSRKQYNSMGKELYAFELEKVQKNPEFSPDLFQTPENIATTVHFRDDFFTFCAELQRLKVNGDTPVKLWSRLNRMFFSPVAMYWISGVLLVFGVGIFVFVLYAKIKASRTR